jgi:DNA-binding NarL/FixJ family response regulator
MDVSRPDLDGIEATRRIVAESPEVRVLALSMHSDRRYVLAMFGAGAVGYLLKDAASNDLITAVESISRSGKFVSPSITEAATADGSPQGRELSAREREVLQLLAEGCSSKDIASRLQIALPTVETHRRQITNKLGLRTIAELTKWAIREGLTPLER